MINGISWLVVTKLDVLDHLTEIPVCVGYKVDGKETDEVPAQACGYEKIECVYRKDAGLGDLDAEYAQRWMRCRRQHANTWRSLRRKRERAWE